VKDKRLKAKDAQPCRPE